jgi:hypothetical protein
MNDKDKEAFKIYCGEEQVLSAELLWQADCEYKQKELEAKLAESVRKLLIFSDDLDDAGNELFMQEGRIKELEAKNAELEKKLELAVEFMEIRLDNLNNSKDYNRSNHKTTEHQKLEEALAAIKEN